MSKITNKCVFGGIVTLGFMLLVNHLAVTIIIGLGPQFLTSSHKTISEVENFNQKLAEDIKNLQKIIHRDPILL